MIRNRVIIAGILFCLLFISILFVFLSNENHQTSGFQEQKTAVHSPIGVLDNNGTTFPGNNLSNPDPSTLNPDISPISGAGTVVYQDLEGGFFGVVSTDGRLFLPQGLPAHLKVNGTEVSFSFRPEYDTVSVYMWGEPVEILFIHALNPDDKSDLNPYLIEYEKAGGISGSYEFIRLDNYGTGEVSRWNRVEAINLTTEEIQNLTNIFDIEDFEALKSEYLPTSPSPDIITYTLTIGNKSIKTTEKEMPEKIKPAINILNDLLDKYSISPITANMTLAGTAWRLVSFIRPDGIPVILPDNSQVSAIFQKDMMITGSTGCNSYSGSYNQSGSNLSFGNIMATKMACIDPGKTDIESIYLQLLEKIRIVAGKQRTLSMADINNTTLLNFDQMKE